MATEVKRCISNLPEGLYRATKTTYGYYGGKLHLVVEGKVVRLLEGEANHHFESMGGGVPQNSKTADILNALNRLDAENKSHWTAKGLPQMVVIETMVGDTSITRKDVEEARPGFCRDVLLMENAKNPDNRSLEDFGQGKKKKSNHEEI